MLALIKIALMALLLPASLLAHRSRHPLALLVLLLQMATILLGVEYARQTDAPEIRLLLLGWPVATVLALVFSYKQGEAATLATLPPPTGTTDSIPASRASEFYKEMYEELYSTERHVGTLRTRIAWAPAALTTALFAVFIRPGQANDQGRLASSTISPDNLGLGVAMVVLIFGLIFVADRYLLKTQKTASLMCQECERLWLAAAGASEVQTNKVCVSRFRDIKAVATTKLRRDGVMAPDIPNTLLGMYFMALIVMTLALSGEAAVIQRFVSDFLHR